CSWARRSLCRVPPVQQLYPWGYSRPGAARCGVGLARLMAPTVRRLGTGRLEEPWRSRGGSVGDSRTASGTSRPQTQPPQDSGGPRRGARREVRVRGLRAGPRAHATVAGRRGATAEPQVFDVLLHLVRARDRVVTKEEL